MRWPGFEAILQTTLRAKPVGAVGNTIVQDVLELFMSDKDQPAEMYSLPRLIMEFERCNFTHVNDCGGKKVMSEEYCLETAALLRKLKPAGPGGYKPVINTVVNDVINTNGQTAESGGQGDEAYIDSGPFVMSRYASCDDLHEAMRKYIERLERQLAETKKERDELIVAHDTQVSIAKSMQELIREVEPRLAKVMEKG